MPSFLDLVFAGAHRIELRRIAGELSIQVRRCPFLSSRTCSRDKLWMEVEFEFLVATVADSSD